MKRVCVMGTGYVGLVTGSCLADFGNTVVCVDIDQQRIGKLKEGESPIYEPGLDELRLRARMIFCTLTGRKWVLVP